MKTKIGSTVHPWYNGTHEWNVKAIAELKQPIEYNDPEQGHVSYDPKIMLLENENVGKILWFPYWMATSKTGGRIKYGQRPSMLEESVFLELLGDSIKRGFISKKGLKKLADDIKSVEVDIET
jgi:hypothetical protein